MPSERITAAINDLLDQLGKALREGDWGTVRSRAMDVLALEPDHEDAREFLNAFERRLEMAPIEVRPEESGSDSAEDDRGPAAEYAASQAPPRRSDAESAAAMEPFRRSDITIGVDFGTTNTRIAYRVGKDEPVSLWIGEEGARPWMPSAVAYKRGENGSVSVVGVGETALVFLGTTDDSIRVIQDIKRVMVASGSEDSDSQSLADFKSSAEDFSWWDPDSGKVVLWEKRIEPKKVAVEIIKEALSRVNGLAGNSSEIEFDSGDIGSLELHSGTWALARLKHRIDFLGVLRDAGFKSSDVNSIHMEPVLGMIRRVANATLGERVLVFDLGGGTFDVAIGRLDSYETESETGVITIFATGGEPFCGGIDIDREFVKYLEERVADEFFYMRGNEEDYVEKFRTRLDSEASQKFLVEVRRVKEVLSREKESVFAVLDLADGIDVEMDVKRTEFEDVLVKSGVLARATDACLRKLKQAVTAEQGGFSGAIRENINTLEHEDLNELIDRIILIGGSTEIPAVQKHLRCLWPDVQVIPSGQYESLTGVAEGATMASTFVSRLVDRLPCSVELVDDGESQPIYDAFEPTTQFLLGSPGLSSIRYKIPPTDSPESAYVQYRFPGHEDGTEIKGIDLRKLGDDAWMSVNAVGQMHFGRGDTTVHTLTGPSVMDFQHEIIDRRRVLRRKRDDERRAQTRAMLNRLPYQDPS